MLDHRTKTFMTVCNVMNYREAAELLHITQPAVTQHIQFLEKEYGCRLFLYENRKHSSAKIFSAKNSKIMAFVNCASALRRPLAIMSLLTRFINFLTSRILLWRWSSITPGISYSFSNRMHWTMPSSRDISIKTDSEASSTAKNLLSESARKTTHSPEKKFL